MVAVLVGTAGEHGARAVLPVPDVTGIAAIVYPNLRTEVESDPLRGDEPGWWRFMNNRSDQAIWMITPTVQPSTTDVDAFRAAVEQRLAAAGWRLGTDRPAGLRPGTDRVAAVVEATRGDIHLDVTVEPGGTTGLSTGVEVSLLSPWWVTAAALVSGLAGALLGGWLAGWVARRTARRSSRVRAFTRQAAIIGSVLTVPLVVQTVLPWFAPALPVDLLFTGSFPLLLASARWIAVPALVLGVAIVAVAAQRTPAPPRR